MRHSIAWPRRTTSSWRSDSGSPAATRICSRTRSTPVTSSVTVCSTWMRVFISRKKYSPSGARGGPRSSRPSGSRGARRVDGDLPDPLAQLGRDRRRGRLLDELLVAALDRAVALAEVDDVAVGVGEDLHLDVARVLEVALDVDGRVGEVRPALALRGLERRRRPRRARRRPSSPSRRHRPPPSRASGYPSSSPSATTSSAEPTGSVCPGMIGTPAACIRARATVLWPISSIASGGGPIQTRPADSTARANSAFSARKP